VNYVNKFIITIEKIVDIKYSDPSYMLLHVNTQVYNIYSTFFIHQ